MKTNLKLVNSLCLSPLEEDMRQYALKNDIPIIKDAGLEFLISVIKKQNAKNILEIGTAIGYSASIMARSNNAHVTTIEREETMFALAEQNIELGNLKNQVSLVFMDALDAFDVVKNEKYDLIFIDAAKGQYRKFFEMYGRLLLPGGVIVCDNMDFHGLVTADISTMSRGLRGLVRKLNGFRDFLTHNAYYCTTFSSVGDGMTVSERKIPDLLAEDLKKSIVAKKEYECLKEKDGSFVYRVYGILDSDIYKVIKKDLHGKAILRFDEAKGDFPLALHMNEIVFEGVLSGFYDTISINNHTYGYLKCSDAQMPILDGVKVINQTGFYELSISMEEHL